MKPGNASQTAVLVCMGRALPPLSDPTALALLPDDARARVERIIAGQPPRGARERFERGHMAGLAKMMVARTQAIDDAVRAANAPQVVILGAGLDGRAWRLTCLAAATVFEVDHPDSQRDKRAQLAAAIAGGQLAQTAKDVRFVAVDFTRDSLEAALAAAGHDPARATMWIWEGVVMYLTPADIEATLHVIDARSAPGSRLAIAYHAPVWYLGLVGAFLGRIGEPLRSKYTPAQLRALLAGYRFRVADDGNIAEWRARQTGERPNAITRTVNHLRIAIADRI